MMTNRERLIDLLNRTDYETDMITASFIACPYYSDDDCHNPHDYGTPDFQIFCAKCKRGWADERVSAVLEDQYEGSEVACTYCKYFDKDENEYPCTSCNRNYVSMFERKE